MMLEPSSLTNGVQVDNRTRDGACARAKHVPAEKLPQVTQRLASRTLAGIRRVAPIVQFRPFHGGTDKQPARSVKQISLNPSAITRVLGAMAFLLVLASVAGQISKFALGHDYLKGFVPLFDVDREYNIPSFFSTLLLIFASLLLAVITVLNGKEKVPHVSKWAILSFGFLLMAYDEAFQVHESLGSPVRRVLGLGDGNLGVFHAAWVIPGIALTLVLGLFFLRFLLYQPATTRLAFSIAVILYIGGAVGFELIEGLHIELSGQDATYTMMATVEESLEMVGVIVFIRSLLVYIADNHKEVRLRFERARGAVMMGIRFSSLTDKRLEVADRGDVPVAVEI